MWVTVRAASHPPVWIHRKCELRSLKKMLNGLCWDDDYTIAQWLEHRWLQARVPGSSPGGDSQFFLQTFPVCLFPSNQSILLLLLLLTFILLGCFPQTYGLLTGASRKVMHERINLRESIRSCLRRWEDIVNSSSD